MTFRRTEPVPIAAAKAGFSTATAYRIEQDPRPPSERAPPRERRRPDPLAAIWDSEVVPLLQVSPGLRPIAVFEEMRRRHPGLGAGTRRSGPIGPRVRRKGGGRKSAVTLQPELPGALETLIEDAIRGDPETPLRWVSRSQRQIARVLGERGFVVSQKLVGLLLRELGYSCQANCKTREGTNHPDRNAQFAHINTVVQAAMAAGQPAISVDTKKKELVGDFKNPGRELRSKGQPEPVRVHDFELPDLGKVAPYGVYDLAANAGWVNVGVDADTAAFAVESIRRWWQQLGQTRYPDAKHSDHPARGSRRLSSSNMSSTSQVKAPCAPPPWRGSATLFSARGAAGTGGGTGRVEAWPVIMVSSFGAGRGPAPAFLGVCLGGTVLASPCWLIRALAWSV